jgi:hypothetical protein
LLAVWQAGQLSGEQVPFEHCWVPVQSLLEQHCEQVPSGQSRFGARHWQVDPTQRRLPWQVPFASVQNPPAPSMPPHATPVQLGVLQPLLKHF